jgi:16S rRNA (uracil1498-N3)-methyltransferase
MKIHRFLGDFNFKKEQLKITDRDLVHQLRSVLRMKPGFKFELVNQGGEGALVELIKIEASSIEAKVLELLPQVKEGRKITLFVAILKRENFELVAQKATEIGVHTLVPIITKRTVKTGLKVERLEKIINEATEQSGRTNIMQLEETVNFTEALASIYDKKIIFDQSGDKVRKIASDSDSLAIFIGPEGGWDEGELSVARESGFSVLSLGETTLRAETAAIVASYLGVNEN